MITLPDLRITYRCTHCHKLAGIPFWGMEILDNNTTLTCDKCQGKTHLCLSANPTITKELDMESQYVRSFISFFFSGRRMAKYSPGDVVTTSVGELINRKHSVRRKVRGYPLGCVYIVKDEDKRPLYIGVTNYQAHYRIANHIQTQSCLGKAIRDKSPDSYEWEVEIIKTANRKSGRQREKQLIEKLRPLYNIQGKSTDGR